jgi:hypothetical protein
MLRAGAIGIGIGQGDCLEAIAGCETEFIQEDGSSGATDSSTARASEIRIAADAFDHDAARKWRRFNLAS